MKKSISLLLALLLVMSMMPLAFAGGIDSFDPVKALEQQSVWNYVNEFGSLAVEGHIFYVPTDGEGRIRIDDWELQPDVQAKVDELMAKVNESNVAEVIDLAGIQKDFLNINGFAVDGVDYEKDVERMDVIDA